MYTMVGLADFIVSIVSPFSLPASSTCSLVSVCSMLLSRLLMHKPIFLCGRMTVISILGCKIDLLTLIFLHGLGLALYGLYMAFCPLASKHSCSKECTSIIGFTMTALELGYLRMAYMPQEQNAFL